MSEEDQLCPCPQGPVGLGLIELIFLEHKWNIRPILSKELRKHVLFEA